MSRCAIFLDDDDRTYYLRFLKEKSGKLQVKAHAYVLMDNHVHPALSSDTSGAISGVMKHAGQSYVISFHRRQQRIGTLWEERFKSCLIDTKAYRHTDYRYLELNPVRAVMVDDPKRHVWVSVPADVGTHFDPLVSPHERFVTMATDVLQRAYVCRAWLRAGANGADVQRIRHICSNSGTRKPSISVDVRKDPGSDRRGKALRATATRGVLSQ